MSTGTCCVPASPALLMRPTQTFLGVGFVGCAYFWQGDNWLLSVLVNLGTTLVLFALLVYFEGRLFGKLHGPQNLEDACDLVSAALDRFSRRRSGQPAENADPSIFARNIGTLIKLGKFVPATADSDSTFAYKDAKGGGVTWRLCGKERGEIRHEIRIPGRVSPLTESTPLPTADGLFTVSDHVQQSERDVFDLMCKICHEID